MITNLQKAMYSLPFIGEGLAMRKYREYQETEQAYKKATPLARQAALSIHDGYAHTCRKAARVSNYATIAVTLFALPYIAYYGRGYKAASLILSLKLLEPRIFKSNVQMYPVTLPLAIFVGASSLGAIFGKGIPRMVSLCLSGGMVVFMCLNNNTAHKCEKVSKPEKLDKEASDYIFRVTCGIRRIFKK